MSRVAMLRRWQPNPARSLDSSVRGAWLLVAAAAGTFAVGALLGHWLLGLLLCAAQLPRQIWTLASIRLIERERRIHDVIPRDA